MSEKFKELKSLVIDYKNDKDKEIQELKEDLGKFKIMVDKNKETYEYLDLFGQIFDRVREEYVDEVTDEELIEKAIDGMLTGLDPHSGWSTLNSNF